MRSGSFNAGGWFARDAAVLAKVGDAILHPATKRVRRNVYKEGPADPSKFDVLFLAEDAFQLALPEVKEAAHEVKL